jgi:hypothetical protein
MNVLFLGFALAALLGCAHAGAQVPPASTEVVNLTWQAPSAAAGWQGCTASAPCSYAIYSSQASGGTCKPLTDSSWHEITTPASRPTGSTFTDNAPGTSPCYNAETIQNGANSAASNTAGPIAIPATPLAPTLGNPAAAGIPVPPAGELAMMKPLTLTATKGR